MRPILVVHDPGYSDRRQIVDVLLPNTGVNWLQFVQPRSPSGGCPASKKKSPFGNAIDQNARWLLFALGILAAIVAFPYGRWQSVAFELSIVLLVALVALLSAMYLSKGSLRPDQLLEAAASAASKAWQSMLNYLDRPNRFRFGAMLVGIIIGVILSVIFGLLVILGSVIGPSINWAAVATIVGAAVAATYYVTYLRHSRDTAKRQNLFKLQDEYNGSYIRRARFHLAQAYLASKQDPPCLRSVMLLFQKLASMVDRREVDESAAYGLFAVALIRWCEAAERANAVAGIQPSSPAFDRALSLRGRWAERYRTDPPDGIDGFLQHEMHRSQVDFASPSELTDNEIDRLKKELQQLQMEATRLKERR